MSYCLNAACSNPKNPDSNRFCERCGWRLRLGDRYEAVQPFGMGQNSRTFIGRDRTTLVQPQCLIKRFLPAGQTALEQATAAERFRQDVEHLAIASQHSQIPDLRAAFEREDQQFLVQQFLTGLTLEQCLQANQGPFDSLEVEAFLRDVLPILHYLHQHHLIHRDIKPANFRRPPGQPHWWLVDLGVFKPLTATRMMSPGTLVGSADYAAPEQLRGEATVASDIYSLGVVCLRLLTGLQPFDLFDSAHGLWHWRNVAPNVSSRLATVIDGMVQPALRDRTATIARVMNGLGLPMSMPSEPPPAQFQPAPWSPTATIDTGTNVVAVTALPAQSQLLLLLGDGEIQGRSLIAPIQLDQAFPLPAANATAITAHPQQPAFVVGFRSGYLHQWHWHNQAWHDQPLAAIATQVTQLCFAPDGNRLLIGDGQGQIHSWDWLLGRSQPSLMGHTAGIASLSVDPQTHLLASGDTQGQIQLWQLPTGEPLRTLSRQAGAITDLAWGHQGTMLLTSGWDVTLRWRSPQTGGILHQIQAQGFCLPVRSVWSHPSASLVLTGSQDGKVQLWSTRSEIPQAVTCLAMDATETDPIVAVWGTDTKLAEDGSLVAITAAGKIRTYPMPKSLKLP